MVVRHELPQFLPGYITVIMTDPEGATFKAQIIEIEESEAHFALGNTVEIVAVRDASNTERYQAPWLLGTQRRPQRVERVS